MSNKLALDALITALACLLPELNSDHQVQLNTHKAFYADNPNLFCDVKNHLNEKFKNLGKQKEQNQRDLLKLQWKLLQLEEQMSNNTSNDILENHNCKGLEFGIYKFNSDIGSMPFYTVCEDQKILILQHYGENKPTNITKQQSQKGFGIFYDDFFLGLDNIINLINDECYEAFVVLKNADYETSYAYYTELKILKNDENYEMLASQCRGDSCDILGKPMKRSNIKKNCMELHENTRYWWDFSCDENEFVKIYLKSCDANN